MFTGLIEEIGVVVETGGDRLALQAGVILDGLRLGDSVAVNGACLTVDHLAAGYFRASLLPETAARTTLGALRRGRRVNLERPLRLGDRLGGHLVAGHVDGLATLLNIQDRGDTRLLELECPSCHERYLVDRGSVALEGVSLTVIEPKARRFRVALVGATLSATTLAERRPGDPLNFEADLLAKHIERLLESRRESETEHDLIAWLAESE